MDLVSLIWGKLFWKLMFFVASLTFVSVEKLRLGRGKAEETSSISDDYGKFLLTSKGNEHFFLEIGDKIAVVAQWSKYKERQETTFGLSNREAGEIEGLRNDRNGDPLCMYMAS